MAKGDQDLICQALADIEKAGRVEGLCSAIVQCGVTLNEAELVIFRYLAEAALEHDK